MMISIKVKDFRGCERAEITCGPLALVAAPNAQGKSSIAQATGAALCGNALPLPGLAKTTAGLLIKLGASAASVELRSETGTTRIDWPACNATSQGQPPRASEWASGLASVALLPAKDRARVLGTYLHADPTREDLAQALGDAEFEEAASKSAWQLIEAHGWDAAHTLRKEKGAELKGRWRQAAGTNYGSRVAASWLPADWSELNRDGDLDDANDNDLGAAIGRANDAHEKAIAAAAVSQADRQRLEETAELVDERKDRLADAEIEEARLEEALAKAEAERAALPPAGAEAAMPCPHCGEPVVLRQIDLATRRLEKAERVPATEVKKRRVAIAEADGALGRLRSELAAQACAVEVARDAMQLALDARSRLAKTPDTAGQDLAGAVGRAKTALDLAVRRLAVFRQKRIADDLRRSIRDNEALLEILAPDGLRAKKLARVLEVFNATQLAPLCGAAEWKPVAVDPEMTLTYGGRPYALLSTSEQYRVRAVMQLAMARLDGSDMVVLDAADVLDGTTRSGLFVMLDDGGLAALVLMTLSRRNQVPDLAAAGLGASYWLESGICQPQQPAEIAA